jgi:hypothetical protein
MHQISTDHLRESPMNSLLPMMSVDVQGLILPLFAIASPLRWRSTLHTLGKR